MNIQKALGVHPSKHGTLFSTMAKQVAGQNLACGRDIDIVEPCSTRISRFESHDWTYTP